jgi:hypothetical protein
VLLSIFRAFIYIYIILLSLLFLSILVLTARIDSYNWSLSTWEPVIEHTLFSLAVTKTEPLDAAVGSVTVSLGVSTLRVNVSPSLLAAIAFVKEGTSIVLLLNAIDSVLFIVY